jgi:hypothetical protein
MTSPGIAEIQMEVRAVAKFEKIFDPTILQSIGMIEMA